MGRCGARLSLNRVTIGAFVAQRGLRVGLRSVVRSGVGAQDLEVVGEPG